MGAVISIDSAPSAGMKLRLALGEAGGAMNRVQNVKWTWAQFVARVKQPTEDVLTLEQYLALPVDKQDKRKNNGWFVAAHFHGGKRKRELMGLRSMLVLDIDQAPDTLLDDIKFQNCGLSRYEFVAYSTRKHTASKPRIRICICVKGGQIDPDQFVPLSRIVAAMLDPDMVMVDVVSFREAQFMYWPSVCKGEEFFYHHNPGVPLDPVETLEAWGRQPDDWRDFSKLPVSPRENSAMTGVKVAQDPTTKKNWIGAFCREYDIHEAIAKFLQDVYEPSEYSGGEPSRYSYLLGSTRNGAVVYDDGKHLYSNHGSDPCADQSVNAFDMVRLHKFGDKDKGFDGDDIRKAPSYAAMLEFINDEEHEVVAEYKMLTLGDTDEAWDDATEDDPEATSKSPAAATADKPESDDWLKFLDLTDKGAVKPSAYNVSLILTNDERFRGKLAFDEFISDCVVFGTISEKRLRVRIEGPTDNVPVLISDNVAALLQIILSAPLRREGKRLGWGLTTLPRSTLTNAIVGVCTANPVHPVRERLLALPAWDGVERIHTLFTCYCHTESNAYTRAASSLLMIGAVARIVRPGIKFDYAVILEGKTGIRKSTFFYELVL